MAKKKQKFYVVWEGRKPGIYTTWQDCKDQITAFEGAKYKSFETKTAAETAYSKSYYSSISPKKSKPKLTSSKKPILDSIVVDAACSGASGDMEYQGFDLKTGRLLFRKGVYKDGTNNVGEFLALVHAIAMCKKNGLNQPIYSDSKTAMAWVRKKKAKTTLAETPRNKELFELMERAEVWLNENTYSNQILKWETKFWGENPADFGRK